MARDMQLARDMQPEFIESGLAYELSTRDISSADERQPVLADNTAVAPGKMCGQCGRTVAAGQDARLLPDGNCIHEACPVAW